MTKFNPKLHPRAKNGKFRSSGFSKYKTNKLRTSGSAARTHILSHAASGAFVGGLASGGPGAVVGAAVGGAIGIAGVSSARRRKVRR